MANLWIFNAGHEESLAYMDNIYRTPKKEIREIRKSLWSLLRYVADENDYILSGDSLDNEFLLVYNRDCRPIELGDLPRELSLKAWAVEPTLMHRIKKRFASEGIDIQLPYISKDIYSLSHRNTSTILLNRIINNTSYISDSLCPLWINVSQANAFEVFAKYIADIRERWYPMVDSIIMKRPYTSSGRGVLPFYIPIDDKGTRELFDKLILFREFSIEPKWKIKRDWACEFYIDDAARCDFVAFSSFKQNVGKYTGNILKSQKELYKELSEEIYPISLESIIQEQLLFITDMFSLEYVGYLGIDMFTYYNPIDNSTMLYPAVEINLRMTMGLIAHFIYLHNEAYINELSKSKLEDVEFLIEYNKANNTKALLLSDTDKNNAFSAYIL